MRWRSVRTLLAVRRFRAVGACLLSVALLGLQGCGGDESSSSSSAVASITISPTTGAVVVKGTQTFTATAADSSGNTLSGITFTWNSSATNVATIDTSGVATGHASGSTQITASASGITSSAATLTVNPSVTSVSISPTSATIKVGETQQFVATAKDVNGNVVSNIAFTWNNSFAGVATINSTGLATGISPGSVLITASVGNVSSPIATLTVTQ